MTDSPSGPAASPETGDESMGPDPEATVGPPRWVKVFGIIALVLALLVVVVMFVGGGEHGPGRHMP